MSARLLMVDDDRFLLDMMSRLLKGAGYEVAGVATAAGALAACAERPPDLLLLDLGLPDGDGLEICRRLRARHTFPILLLTSRAETFDKVAGFEAGADDYVTKPFEAEELLARIGALLRRAGPSPRLEVGDLVVEPQSRMATAHGRVLDLTETEWRILLLLTECAPAPVSKTELFQRAWGFAIEHNTNSLEVLMYRVRTKLKASGSRVRIETIRTHGYRMREDDGFAQEIEQTMPISTE